MESDEEASSDRESWPSLSEAPSSEYRGVVLVRRENKRLGWRQIVGVLKRDEGLVSLEASFEVSTLRIEKVNKKKPQFRLVLNEMDVGFLDETSRDEWLRELVLAGAVTSPENCPSDYDALRRCLERAEPNENDIELPAEAYFADPDELLVRAAAARCCAAAVTRPRGLARIKTALALMGTERDDVLRALRTLDEPVPRTGALAAIVNDGTRSREARENAAYVLAKNPTPAKALTKELQAGLARFKLLDLSLEVPDDIMVLATSYQRPERPPEVIEDYLREAATRYPFYEYQHSKPEIYDVTFQNGGAHGLGLELTAGPRRDAVAPAVHRTNTATQRKGVLQRDELIEVNGRRLEYSDRSFMLEACEAVREAPWPKRLVFARWSAQSLRASPEDRVFKARETYDPPEPSVALMRNLAGHIYSEKWLASRDLEVYARSMDEPPEIHQSVAEPWFLDPQASFRVVTVTVPCAPLGCTVALREGVACLESLEPRGAAASKGIRVNDVLLLANGEAPPSTPASDTGLVDFFNDLTYPLTLTLGRQTPPIHFKRKTRADTAVVDHASILRECTETKLYTEPLLAALALKGALQRNVPEAFPLIMAIKTTTATAMTPGTIQRLSSWEPPDEGLSRDEAASLVPLADATEPQNAEPRLLRRFMGSALSRLLDIATEESDASCAALECLAALAHKEKKARRACVADSAATAAFVALLGGSRGGKVARAALHLCHNLAPSKIAAQALVEADAIKYLFWLIRKREGLRGVTAASAARVNIVCAASIDALSIDAPECRSRALATLARLARYSDVPLDPAAALVYTDEASGALRALVASRAPPSPACLDALAFAVAGDRDDDAKSAARALRRLKNNKNISLLITACAKGRLEACAALYETDEIRHAPDLAEAARKCLQNEDFLRACKAAADLVADAAPSELARALAAGKRGASQLVASLDESSAFWDAVVPETLWPLLNTRARDAAAACLTRACDQGRISSAGDITFLLDAAHSSPACARALAALARCRALERTPRVRRAATLALASPLEECRAAAAALCGDGPLAKLASSFALDSETARDAGRLAALLDDDDAAPLAVLRSVDFLQLSAEATDALLAKTGKSRACALAVLSKTPEPADVDSAIVAVLSKTPEPADADSRDVFAVVEVEAAARLAVKRASSKDVAAAVVNALARPLPPAPLVYLCDAAALAFSPDASAGLTDKLLALFDRDADVVDAAAAALVVVLDKSPVVSVASFAAVARAAVNKPGLVWALRRVASLNDAAWRAAARAHLEPLATDLAASPWGRALADTLAIAARAATPLDLPDDDELQLAHEDGDKEEEQQPQDDEVPSEEEEEEDEEDDDDEYDVPVAEPVVDRNDDAVDEATPARPPQDDDDDPDLQAALALSVQDRAAPDDADLLAALELSALEDDERRRRRQSADESPVAADTEPIANDTEPTDDDPRVADVAPVDVLADVAPADVLADAARPSNDAAAVAPVADDAAGVARPSNDADDAPPVSDDAADAPPVADDAADAPPVADDAPDVAPVADDSADVAPAADDAVDVAPVADDAVDVAPPSGDEPSLAETAAPPPDEAPPSFAEVVASPGPDEPSPAEAVAPPPDEAPPSFAEAVAPPPPDEAPPSPAEVVAAPPPPDDEAPPSFAEAVPPPPDDEAPPSFAEAVASPGPDEPSPAETAAPPPPDEPSPAETAAPPPPDEAGALSPDEVPSAPPSFAEAVAPEEEVAPPSPAEVLAPPPAPPAEIKSPRSSNEVLPPPPAYDDIVRDTPMPPKRTREIRLF